MTTCFSDLDTKLQRGVADLGFTAPTPIQAKAIPPASEGRDVLACAMTGSGKTAAFLLPTLQRILSKKPGTTRALVLSPTRELAAQTVAHFNDLAKYTNLRSKAVYGGVGMRPQEQAFRKGVDVMVACPGRLLDHLSRPYGRLDGLEILILDEADRMLDMGFLPDIRRVMKHLPRERQTLLFSATMPREVVKLSNDLLHDPVQLDVERPSAPAKKVVQTVYPVRQDLKTGLLVELVTSGEIGNGLVFTRTKHRADRLARKLSRQGIAADRIHGNRSQAQRTRALADFKSGKTQILVATDIASRGIDVEDLSHVVNFDVPHLADDYIHRVGRTARAEATGEAFTFVSPQEAQTMRAIERKVGKLPRRELDGFGTDAPAPTHDHSEHRSSSPSNGNRSASNKNRSSNKSRSSNDSSGGGRRRRRRSRRHAQA